MLRSRSFNFARTWWRRRFEKPLATTVAGSPEEGSTGKSPAQTDLYGESKIGMGAEGNSTELGLGVPGNLWGIAMVNSFTCVSTVSLTGNFYPSTIVASGAAIQEMTQVVTGTPKKVEKKLEIPAKNPPSRIWDNVGAVRSRHILLDETPVTNTGLVSSGEGERDGNSWAKIVPTPVTSQVADEEL